MEVDQQMDQPGEASEAVIGGGEGWDDSEGTDADGARELAAP